MSSFFIEKILKYLFGFCVDYSRCFGGFALFFRRFAAKLGALAINLVGIAVPGTVWGKPIIDFFRQR